MTNDARANAYLRTQVMSASQEELRLMLIDGAIKFTTMGRDGLESKDLEKSYEGFSQARAIVTELMTSVRTDVAPELCERVRSLYTFMYTELVSASLEKDVVRADRVIELLGYERETWVLLMEQLKVERASAVTKAAVGAPAPSQAPNPAAAQQAPAVQPKPAMPTNPADPGYRPLSIEG